MSSAIRHPFISNDGPLPNPKAEMQSLLHDAIAALIGRSLDPTICGIGAIPLIERLVAAGLAGVWHHDGRYHIALSGITGIGRSKTSALTDWCDQFQFDRMLAERARR